MTKFDETIKNIYETSKNVDKTLNEASPEDFYKFLQKITGHANPFISNTLKTNTPFTRGNTYYLINSKTNLAKLEQGLGIDDLRRKEPPFKVNQLVVPKNPQKFTGTFQVVSVSQDGKDIEIQLVDKNGNLVKGSKPLKATPQDLGQLPDTIVDVNGNIINPELFALRLYNAFEGGARYGTGRPYLSLSEIYEGRLSGKTETERRFADTGGDKIPVNEASLHKNMINFLNTKNLLNLFYYLNPKQAEQQVEIEKSSNSLLNMVGRGAYNIGKELLSYPV